LICIGVQTPSPAAALGNVIHLASVPLDGFLGYAFFVK